ncbi:hypothetical protein ACFLTK_03465 [Chloroflexota bacterium]
MRGKYFDIERDKLFPFFCQACLVGKAKEEMSKRDPRYCQKCQSIIEYEYSLLSDKGHSKRYKPVKPETKSEAIEVPSVDIDTGEGKMKMSTLNEKTVTVDKFKPRGRPSTYKKRELPEGLIKRLHRKGIGSKTIATVLKKEHGVDVSYKTIQRVLSGNRY